MTTNEDFGRPPGRRLDVARDVLHADHQQITSIIIQLCPFTKRCCGVDVLGEVESRDFTDSGRFDHADATCTLTEKSLSSLSRSETNIVVYCTLCCAAVILMVSTVLSVVLINDCCVINCDSKIRCTNETWKGRRKRFLRRWERYYCKCFISATRYALFFMELPRAKAPQI